MNKLLDIVKLHAAIGRGLDHLRPLLLAGTRLWVAWQFLKSGWLKISNWDSTLELFRSEYHVPLMPPAFAAVAGTFGASVAGVCNSRASARASNKAMRISSGNG